MSEGDEEFGDVDPEDAWDDGDDEDTKLAVIERAVCAIEDCGGDVSHERVEDDLRLLDKLSGESRRRADHHLDELRERLEDSA